MWKTVILGAGFFIQLGMGIALIILSIYYITVEDYSLTMFIIPLVLAVSAVASGIIGSVQMYRDYQTEKYDKFIEQHNINDYNFEPALKYKDSEEIQNRARKLRNEKVINTLTQEEIDMVLKSRRL